MNKTLLKSVREYKKQSVMAPLLVVLEVFMEVLIPLEMAKIIDVGIAQGDMNYIIQRGVDPGGHGNAGICFSVCRQEIWQPLPEPDMRRICVMIFSIRYRNFRSIISIISPHPDLVTRMTTDITNVQMAYMMSIRLLARAPIMVILSWVMTLLAE